MKKRASLEDWQKHRPGFVIVQNIPPGAEVRTDGAQTPANQLQAAVPKSDGNQAMQALGRLHPTEMNQTEQRFADLLQLRMMAGEILWWEFEPMNLRLGVKCFYQIDFMVMLADRSLVAYEVKGRWMDDALVKIRTAAEKFPWPFIAARWIKGEWEYRNF